MARIQPIYDVDTKNLSFLQTAMDLKTLGIKNNLFFLALYNPDLRGVDPYSPFLTQDQIMAIIYECVINPWYFLREVARIPDQGGTGIPYQLNRANLASTYCFINSIDHYLCIPRQIGKTQSTVAILNWAFHFGTTNAEFMFLNKTETDSINNLSRLKAQRDLLPPYLQAKFSYDENGKIIKEENNVKSFKNKATNNKVVVKGKAQSKEAADSIGRGLTQPIQFYDEFEFCPYIKTIMEAAGPAYVTASENSERNHAPHCRIITTTPGDLDSQPGQDAEKVLALTAKWSEEFYDWDIEDVKEYLQRNSENKIMYIEYQYKQLGKDETWFNKVCAALNNDKLKIRREIFLERMHGSENSPFEPADLAGLAERQGKVIEEFFLNKFYKFEVYTHLERNQVYLVGVDVSNGYGLDYTAITIFDPYTEKVVADFKSSVIGVTALYQLLVSLVRNMLPKAVLIIERNMNGEAVLDLLRNSPVYYNVYFDNAKDLVADGIDEATDAQGFLVQQAKRRQLYGVYTKGKSRDQMMGLLETYVVEKKDSIVSKNIINDIFKLVINRRGKIEAASGEHDDCVMSFLVLLYVFHYGNNLQRFGFIKGHLPNEKEANQGLTYEDIKDTLDESVRSIYENFSTQTQEDFGKKMREEIERARRETSYIDNYFSDNKNVEVVPLDRDGFAQPISSDFFDYLNS